MNKLKLDLKSCYGIGELKHTLNFENNTNSKGTMFGLSIAAFVCSFFYIASIVGFIMGLIVLSANKEKKCTARSFGIAAVAISSVWLGFFIIFLLALGL